MYSPKFTITNKILHNIGIIEACKEVINYAPIVPIYEKKFADEAIMATVHHATHIEGNDLSFDQVGQVLEGKKPMVGEREAQEVINYRNVLRLVEAKVGSGQRGEGSEGKYDNDLVLEIQSRVVERIVPLEQQGKYRKVQVILRNSQTGEVVFRPPPAPEVPYLMEEFLKWLNSKEGFEVHPVLRAAIAAYAIFAIHPFTEGDGRTARALATLILYREGYDTRKLFSLEEYFDKYANDYYEQLRLTDLTAENDFTNRDLTGWIEFFSQALAIQLTNVKDKVRKLSIDTQIKNRLGGKQVGLNERQVKIMEYLEVKREGIMKDFKPLLPMISEDTILRELVTLMKQKLIKKVGSRKAAKYVLK